MELETTAFERVLHLLLFLSGGVAGGLVALALLERIGGDGKPVIRLPYVGMAVGVFVLFFAAERAYHM